MEGFNTVKIGKLLNRSDSSIGRFLRKNGFKNTGTNSKLTNNDKKLIRQLYLSGLTSKQIYENYFKNKVKCEETIQYNIRKMKISRNRGNINIIDHNYFKEINTCDKAYFLGLLLMDGNVINNRKKGNCWTIQISLIDKDKYILEKLKENVKSDNKVGSSNNMCYFSMFSSKMASDLKKYGIIPRKSLVLEKLPNIEDKYMPDLIRGIFDANGSVYITNKNKKLHFSFYSTHSMLESIKDLLRNKLNFPNNKIIDQKKHKVSLMSFSAKKDIINFYNYIYYNEEVTCLKRKKDKFYKYLF